MRSLRITLGCSMKLTILLTVFAFTAAQLGFAQEDANRVVQSKIVALEKAWNQAYKLGDKQALGRILDDQIVLINDDGSMQTKQEFLATVKKSNSQDQQVAPESMSVHVFGSTAISTGVFRAKGVEAGKPYVRRERFVDTWIYKNENWVCVATNATPVLHGAFYIRRQGFVGGDRAATNTINGSKDQHAVTERCDWFLAFHEMPNDLL